MDSSNLQGAPGSSLQKDGCRWATSLSCMVVARIPGWATTRHFLVKFWMVTRIRTRISGFCSFTGQGMTKSILIFSKKTRPTSLHLEVDLRHHCRLKEKLMTSMDLTIPPERVRWRLIRAPSLNTSWQGLTSSIFEEGMFTSSFPGWKQCALILSLWCLLLPLRLEHRLRLFFEIHHVLI